MCKIKETFTALYLYSDAIEVDGEFIRYYSTEVKSHSDDPAEVIIEEEVDGEIILLITLEDLETIAVNTEGSEWLVAGYTIRFFDVDLIEIP